MTTTTKKTAALAALLTTAACGPVQHVYDAHPSDLEGLEPFPAETEPAAASPVSDDAADDVEATPNEVVGEPEAVAGGDPLVDAEGVPVVLRATLAGEFGPLGEVVDEATPSLVDWYGAESLMLDVVTDEETGERAMVVVRNYTWLLAQGPTDGPVPLADLASVWICSEGRDEDDADWSWDQPSTEGTVEILSVGPGLLEYRFDVQGQFEQARHGRSWARASFVRQLEE